MSHFTVMVVTDSDDSDEIDGALRPFHEFECTGIDDKHVQNIDQLPQLAEEYKTATATLVVQRPDGSKVYAFDNQGDYIEELRQFYDRHALDSRLKLPEGWVELRGEPIKEYQSFKDFCIHEGGAVIEGSAKPNLAHEHKYGWTRVEGDKVLEVVRRTNPNKKWDWWEMGGRWSGFFKLKSNRRGVKGRPGLMGSELDPAGADQARKRDIDFEIRIAEGRRDAAERWDKADAAIGGRSFRTWTQVRDEDFPGEIDKARDAYGSQPVVIDFRKALGPWEAIEAFTGLTRNEYIEREGYARIATFAVLKDGQWLEKGDMGWWGCVADDKGRKVWNQEFKEILASIPDDKFLTVVDCHI